MLLRVLCAYESIWNGAQADFHFWQTAQADTESPVKLNNNAKEHVSIFIFFVILLPTTYLSIAKIGFEKNLNFVFSLVMFS